MKFLEFLNSKEKFEAIKSFLNDRSNISEISFQHAILTNTNFEERVNEVPELFENIKKQTYVEIANSIKNNNDVLRVQTTDPVALDRLDEDELITLADDSIETDSYDFEIFLTRVKSLINNYSFEDLNVLGKKGELISDIEESAAEVAFSNSNVDFHFLSPLSGGPKFVELYEQLMEQGYLTREHYEDVDDDSPEEGYVGITVSFYDKVVKNDDDELINILQEVIENRQSDLSSLLDAVLDKALEQNIENKIDKKIETSVENKNTTNLKN